MHKQPSLKRTPYDGKPYYCTTCGLGWPEVIACEGSGCEIESEDEARQRAEAARATAQENAK